MGYSGVGTDWTDISFDAARAVLKEWRENGARRSEEVVEIWEHVLSRNPTSLGDELWVVYEQVCVAALDSSRLDLAGFCIDALGKRFPRSNRVMKLEGMRAEAMENYSMASKIYDQLIEIDPTNNSFRKRKIAVLLAERKRLDAIRELNDYLKIFLNDSEAWLQLSELFLAESDFVKAAHCLEECVLAAPLNTLFLRRLGDIRYTQGGPENIELAKSYYEQAAKLNPADVRAHYGIVLCTNFLAGRSTNADRKKEWIVAGGVAIDNITARYEEADGHGENPELPFLIESVQAMKADLGQK